MDHTSQTQQTTNTDDALVQNEQEITLDIEDEEGEENNNNEENGDEDEEAMKAAMGFTSFQSSTSREYFVKQKHGSGGGSKGGSVASAANSVAIGTRGAGSGGETGREGQDVLPVHLRKKRRVDEAGTRDDGEEEVTEGVESQEYGEAQGGAVRGEGHALFKESFIEDPWRGLVPTRLPPMNSGGSRGGG